jgi:galactosamine-6-phosphate isomerase
MPGLKFITEKEYETMSRVAAELINEELKKEPGLLLCVSAGGTPTRTYQLLASCRQKDPRSFAELRVLQIDEWAGVPAGSPARCETDLQVKLLEPLGITRTRYCGFKSDAASPSSECDRIARWLDANGPIDICILGLGINGHIAMNEPADKVEPAVHVARLSKSSQKHPLLKQLSKKPRFGLTLGMGDILSSRQLLLLVSGKRKRAALKRLREPHVTTKFPASFLWLHPNAVVLCDREAANPSRFQK